MSLKFDSDEENIDTDGVIEGDYGDGDQWSLLNFPDS